MLLTGHGVFLIRASMHGTLIESHEFRIYGDDYASLYAVVDERDYHWAINWLWLPKYSRGGRKCYLYRTDRAGVPAYSLYLHVAIMQRTGIEPPSPLHTMVDHRDGNGLNCRRANLRWATPSMNRRNINGEYGYDLVDDYGRYHVT